MRRPRLTVVASRRHGGERLASYLDSLSTRFEIDRVPVGSSLKFCILAAGEADLYPRLGPTSEWDIARRPRRAARRRREAMRLDGQPIAYNAKDSLLNADFLAGGPTRPSVARASAASAVS